MIPKDVIKMHKDNFEIEKNKYFIIKTNNNHLFLFPEGKNEVLLI